MENKNKPASQTLNDLLEALSSEAKREPMQPERITALAQAISAVLIVAVNPIVGSMEIANFAEEMQSWQKNDFVPEDSNGKHAKGQSKMKNIN